MLIRKCSEEDVDQICEIYNYYVQNTVISFEEKSVSREAMLARVLSYTQLYPWLVCESEEAIIGYAYATKWKERIAYRHTCETTIYMRSDFLGKGYGKSLYSSLLRQLSISSNHVILGCIALPNKPSVGLHESLGFEKVAHFREVGFKFNQWLDVGYWQITQSA